MRYLLLLLLLLLSCTTVTTSKHRCDNKVGVEKESCLEAYDNFVRNLDYREFRGGGRKFR